MLTRRWLLAGALVVALAGCGAEDVADVDPDRAFVDLELTDASVEPSSHRSWTLLMDDELALATVTDYEEVVFEQQAPMPARAWARLLDRVGPAMDRARDAGAEGCAGGVTLRVRTYEASDAGDVGRGDSEVLDDVEITTCTPEGRDAVADLQRLVTPLAQRVDLPAQARTWPDAT